MSDEIEITVTEIDPDTGARVTRRVKIEKTGAGEARLTDAAGKKRDARWRPQARARSTPLKRIRSG
jgi:hypothetical protein